MSSASWMVVVMTLVTAGLIVWLELHCRRSRRQSGRERPPDSTAFSGKRGPGE